MYCECILQCLFDNTRVLVSVASPGSVGYIIATKKIVLNTDFKTTANELYLTLTSREVCN